MFSLRCHAFWTNILDRTIIICYHQYDYANNCFNIIIKVSVRMLQKLNFNNISNCFLELTTIWSFIYRTLNPQYSFKRLKSDAGWQGVITCNTQWTWWPYLSLSKKRVYFFYFTERWKALTPEWLSSDSLHLLNS